MFDLSASASWPGVGLLALTAIAAVTDARCGVIPNWLTASALLYATVVHALNAGAEALAIALGSALLCAAAPLLLFCARAMGGGDVKLFAAIGALCGLRFGLEVQLASYALALAYACGVLCWRRRLLTTFGRSLRIATATLTRRTLPPAESSLAVRLGPATFCASVLLLARAAFEAAP